MSTKIADARDAVEWLRRPNVKKQLDKRIKNTNTRKSIEVLTWCGGVLVDATNFPFDAVVELANAFEEDLEEAFEEE